MDNISFRMAGSGSWQNLLRNWQAEQFYGKIYPAGILLKDIDMQFRPLIEDWQKGKIIRIEHQRVIPAGPVVTDVDLGILAPWIGDISGTMVTAIENHLSEYHAMANTLAHKGNYTPEKYQNILTIQICAHTLDSWVFSLLRKDVMGTYSPRDTAGTFFFWGYGFSSGAKRIFGFTTYGVSRWLQIHVLRSHGLDREALKAVLRKYGTLEVIQQLYFNHENAPMVQFPGETANPLVLKAMRNLNLIETDPHPRLAIPVFSEKDMKPLTKLYQKVAQIIFNRFLETMPDLKKLASECSFSQCMWSDVLCMLFHLSYSYAADTLVDRGVIEDFPKSAGGEWGVWIH